MPSRSRRAAPHAQKEEQDPSDEHQNSSMMAASRHLSFCAYLPLRNLRCGGRAARRRKRGSRTHRLYAERFKLPGGGAAAPCAALLCRPLSVDRSLISDSNRGLAR